MQRLDSYSPYQFTLFRCFFGVLIAFCLFPMLWHGPDLFSSRSMVPDPAMNWTYGYFINPLDRYDSPEVIVGVVSLALLLSILYTLGIFRRTSAVLLWICWTCLFNRNNFVGHPGVAFVGWLLLASALVPLGEPLALGGKRERQSGSWFMPRALFRGAWLVLAVSYSMSGLLKAASPSWIDGTAIYYVTRTANTYQWWLADWVREFPLSFWRGVTWLTLGLEVLFLPLSLFSKGRALAWGAMLALHVGIACFFDFIELTLSLVAVHLFTFDARWLPPKAVREKSHPTIFYDGVCGLCDRFVQFVLAEDKSGIFRLAPLQGETAKQALGEDAAALKSVVLVDEKGNRFERSAAVLRILSWMGGLWTVARLFFLVPAPLRDVVYNFIARRRYRIFGKFDACKIPTPDQRSRFLD